jgi:hypothetical protein
VFSYSVQTEKADIRIVTGNFDREGMLRSRIFHAVSPYALFLKKYGSRASGKPKVAKQMWAALPKDERAAFEEEAKATRHWRQDPEFKQKVKKTKGLGAFDKYLQANIGKLAKLSPADKLTLMLRNDGWEKVKAKIDNSNVELLSCEVDRFDDAAQHGVAWDNLADLTAETVDRKIRKADKPLRPAARTQERGGKTAKHVLPA